MAAQLLNNNDNAEITAQLRHNRYVYTFGVYKCTRKEMNCDCAGSFVEENTSENTMILSSQIPPWWRKDGMDGDCEDIWPKRPQSLIYKSVHFYHSTIGPWCTYVLTHEYSVAASLLTTRDFDKFQDIDGRPGYRMISNQVLFGENFANRTSLKGFLELKQKIEIALEYVREVVPKRAVKDYLTQISSGELAQDIANFYTPSASANPVVSVNPEVVEILIKSAIKHTIQEISKDMTKQLEENQLYVNKEIQKNEWYTNLLRSELEKRGLIIKEKWHQSEYSLFGKSLPDFCFYRGETSIQGGMARVFGSNDDDIDDDDDDDAKRDEIKKAKIDLKVNVPVHLKGSTAQFKEEGDKKFWPQMFADMGRVAHFLAVESLQVGKRVDSIEIFGILAKYKPEQSTPMLLKIDFTTNESTISVGTDMSLGDCLATVCFKIT